MILVLIVIVLGHNTIVRIVVPISIILLAIAQRNNIKNNPTCGRCEAFQMLPPPNPIVPDGPYYPPTHELQFENPNVASYDFNDRYANRQLYGGMAARQINYGMTKNKMDNYRSLHQSSMDYYDDVDWWNENRTFNHY